MAEPGASPIVSEVVLKPPPHSLIDGVKSFVSLGGEDPSVALSPGEDRSLPWLPSEVDSQSCLVEMVVAIGARQRFPWQEGVSDGDGNKLWHIASSFRKEQRG